MMKSVAFALLAIAAAESITGGELKVTWSDCGGADTDGKITDVEPKDIAIGASSTLTGTGTLKKAETGGTFAITAKASILTEHYNGNICEAKTFDLPLNLGTVVWQGMKCPLAAGPLDVKIGFSMASSIPASLAKATIDATATATNGDKLLCLNAQIAPASDLESAGNVTIYKIDSPKKGDCGQSSCPAGVAHFPVQLGGYTEGTCASVGYTVADGKQEFKVPVWGKTVEIDLFKKPSDLEKPSDITFTYKNCDSKAHGQVTALDVQPPNAKAGDNITVTATVSIDKATSAINSDLVFAKVFHNKFDGCAGATIKAPLGIATVIIPPPGCPLAVGEAKFIRYVATSKATPKASTTSHLEGKDQDGQPFICVDMTLKNGDEDIVIV